MTPCQDRALTHLGKRRMLRVLNQDGPDKQLLTMLPQTVDNAATDGETAAQVDGTCQEPSCDCAAHLC